MSNNSFVIIMSLDVNIVESQSLKEKRAKLNRIKAWLRTHAGASVAEVSHRDSVQRSGILLSICGDSEGSCNERADAIERYLDVNVLDHWRSQRRIVSWNDLEPQL